MCERCWKQYLVASGMNVRDHYADLPSLVVCNLISSACIVIQAQEKKHRAHFQIDPMLNLVSI